jgi:hypothetical protein
LKKLLKKWVSNRVQGNELDTLDTQCLRGFPLGVQRVQWHNRLDTLDTKKSWNKINGLWVVSSVQSCPPYGGLFPLDTDSPPGALVGEGPADDSGRHWGWCLRIW